MGAALIHMLSWEPVGLVLFDSHWLYCLFSPVMITDVQLAIFANVLGVTLFLLVVLFHYVAANNPKNKE